MRLMFLGSGAFGLPTLAALAQSSKHRIVAVVTQPDRPAGRGMDLTPTPIGAWAAQHLPAVPLHKIERVGDPDQTAMLRALAAPGGSLNIDAWIVIAFGQKLPPALLDGVTAMNLHASLLPRWRGAAPINAAILAGDLETGNSVITLADRMDAGLILAQSRRTIEPKQTAGELHDLLAADGPALIESTLNSVAAHGLRGTPQNESLVTKANKLSKADGWIDFAQGAEECRRRVHGLSPWPGVTVTIQDKPLKLLRVSSDEPDASRGPDLGSARSVSPAHSSSNAPGTILDPLAGTVSCSGPSILCMLEVQPAGGRAMDWRSFSQGRRLAPGERIKAGRVSC